MREFSAGVKRGCSRTLAVRGIALVAALVIVVPLFVTLIVLPLGLIGNSDLSPWLLAIPGTS